MSLLVILTTPQKPVPFWFGNSTGHHCKSQSKTKPTMDKKWEAAPCLQSPLEWRFNISEEYFRRYVDLGRVFEVAQSPNTMANEAS